MSRCFVYCAARRLFAVQCNAKGVGASILSKVRVVFLMRVAKVSVE